MKPTKIQIQSSLRILQSALVSKFGDDASNASSGEGYTVEVQCSGIVIVGEDYYILLEDASVEEAAAFLYGK